MRRKELLEGFTGKFSYDTRYDHKVIHRDMLARKRESSWRGWGRIEIQMRIIWFTVPQ
jgi:hypothetical protein